MKKYKNLKRRKYKNKWRSNNLKKIMRNHIKNDRILRFLFLKFNYVDFTIIRLNIIDYKINSKLWKAIIKTKL